MRKRWKVNPANKKLQDVLGKELDLLPITAQLLINRGLVDTDRAFSFLSPDLKDLHDPFLLKGMDRAVERILSAIAGKEKIAVYGDYDVDGTTATALLALFLRECGVEPLCYIPERRSEGYGLNKDALDKIAAEGVTLLVTVDCGISNVEEVGYAGLQGIECIITDHHECTGDLPPAHAVIDPKQPGCAFPFKGLAGVGVAFNLVVALRSALRERGHFKGEVPNLKRYLDIVAIGTVADMVPLVDENRILVSFGLKELNASARPGLKALCRAAGVRGSTSADDIAYKLAPRINAAGRVKSAEVALRLLLTEDDKEADSLARELEVENATRQGIERKILAEALDMLDETDDDKAIVLASRRWHPGVIGIVASRIVDRYSKPAVMIAVEDGDGELIGKGSVRGVKGVDVLKGLMAASDKLIRYGGHKAAAGLTVAESEIEGFKEAFISYMNGTVSEDALIAEIELDAVVGLDEVDARLISEIERLSPFGLSNRKPTLGAMGASILRSDVVGDKHLKMKVKQNGRVNDCIAFGMAGVQPPRGSACNIAFYPYIDEWQGTRSLRLRVTDLQQAG